MSVLLIAAFVSTATVGPSCRERFTNEFQDADFSERTCRGVGAYKLRVDVNDARDDVILVGNDGEHALRLREIVSRGAFSQVRGPVLWSTEKKTPTAIIVKLSVQDEAGGDDDHWLTHYVVAKITPAQICVVFDGRKLSDAKTPRKRRRGSALPALKGGA